MPSPLDINGIHANEHKPSAKRKMQIFFASSLLVVLGFFPTLNALQEKLLGVIVSFGTGLLGKNKVLGLAQTCQD